MIAHWMAYAALLAVLLGGIATAAEHAARGLGFSTRGVWVAALLGSLLVPALRFAYGTPAPPSAAAEIPAWSAPAPEFLAPLPAPAPMAERDFAPAFSIEVLNRPLLWLWAAGSGVVLLVLLRSRQRLSRARRAWRRVRVGRTPVWLSVHTGPAVVGFLRPEIVLPERVLGWDAEAQRLVLEHEREHVRAGDPSLLAFGWLAVLLCPWSPALWWQLRRLRLAAEIDCDARVLRRRPDVGRYGALLLEVTRIGAGAPLAAVSFSHSRSSLERRIHAMTASRFHRPARAGLATLGLCVVGAALIGAVPVPERPRFDSASQRAAGAGADRAASIAAAPPRGASTEVESSAPAADTTQPRLLNAAAIARGLNDNHPPLLRGPGVAFTPSTENRAAAIGDTVMPRLRNPEDVTRALREAYPPLLRDAGVTGMAVVQFVVDENGRVGETRVVRASHEQFGPAAVRALEQARFTPATLEGRPVRKRVTQPVSFTLPRTGEGELPPISSEAVNRSLVGYAAARANGPEAEEMRARSAEMQRRSAEMRVRGEAMRVRGEEMRVRSEEMRVRHDRTQAAVRAALRQRHPEILRDGLSADRYVWLVADAEGRVEASGILPIDFGPGGSWSSTSVERQLRDRFPTVEADYTIIMGLSLDSARKLNVAWVTPRSKAAR